MISFFKVIHNWFFLLWQRIGRKIQPKYLFTQEEFNTYLQAIKQQSSSDFAPRFALLHHISSRILPEYRWKNPPQWWQNKDFDKYLQRFDEQGSYHNDRRWMLQQLLRLIHGVPGDTAECGVYQGAGSFLICRSSCNNTYKRTHFIFDSFTGLSSPGKFDSSKWNKGDFSCSLDIVRNNLNQFPNTHYCKGWIPQKFTEVSERHFAFVHIDVDLYQPTYDSINFFYPLLNNGGIVVCDDYGLQCCSGATKAIDEFLSDKPEKMLMLSGGGGFFIKGQLTAKN